MKIADFDLDKEILVVAEIGNNHEGDFSLAKKLIVLAREAGANAVKFQAFKTQYYVSKSNKERYDRLRSFEFKENQFRTLSRIAQDEGLLFISTAFDLESASYLNKYVSVFKVASGDNTFYPLLAEIAATGKPMIISSGLADIPVLKRAEQFVRDIWRKKRIEQELAILHCVTSYPVNPEEANLAAITQLKKEFKACHIGYSDHTMGIDAALLSVALGARIVEKHFTIDKNYSSFRDHQISADPAEMSLLVRKIREARIMLGSGVKKPQLSELDIMDQVRRSIVAKHNVPKGKEITIEDITWVRPGGGLPPGREALVIGRRAKRPISKGEQIRLADLGEIE